MIKKNYNCLKKLLEIHFKNKAGHIGSSLSCLQLLIYLYSKRIQEGTDLFLLSKGHAASAWYVVLNELKLLSDDDFNSYYDDKNGTFLGPHPTCSRQIPSIPFGTGSLGNGLGLASGLAFSSRYTKKQFNVYTIISDGDCNEGSTWESALFSAHHNLSNLFVIIDLNGLQGLGYTKDIMNLEPIEEKWKSFGFDTYYVQDGNDLSLIDDTFQKINLNINKPKCIIAKTVKGFGVDFMENKMEWHYLPLDHALYELAVKALEKKFA